jgi:hypothetical protein
MARQVLPLPDKSANFTQRVTLDASNYLLELVWIPREGRWYFRLATEQDETIIGLRKLVPNWDLLKICHHPRRPPGRLYVLGSDLPPTFEGLGAEPWLVCYTPGADLG